MGFVSQFIIPSSVTLQQFVADYSPSKEDMAVYKALSAVLDDVIDQTMDDETWALHLSVLFPKTLMEYNLYRSKSGDVLQFLAALNSFSQLLVNLVNGVTNVADAKSNQVTNVGVALQLLAFFVPGLLPKITRWGGISFIIVAVVLYPTAILTDVPAVEQIKKKLAVYRQFSQSISYWEDSLTPQITACPVLQMFGLSSSSNVDLNICMGIGELAAHYMDLSGSGGASTNPICLEFCIKKDCSSTDPCLACAGSNNQLLIKFVSITTALSKTTCLNVGDNCPNLFCSSSDTQMSSLVHSTDDGGLHLILSILPFIVGSHCCVNGSKEVNLTVVVQANGINCVVQSLLEKAVYNLKVLRKELKKKGNLKVQSSSTKAVVESTAADSINNTKDPYIKRTEHPAAINNALKHVFAASPTAYKNALEIGGTYPVFKHIVSSVIQKLDIYVKGSNTPIDPFQLFVSAQGPSAKSELTPRSSANLTNIKDLSSTSVAESPVYGNDVVTDVHPVTLFNFLQNVNSNFFCTTGNHHDLIGDSVLTVAAWHEVNCDSLLLLHTQLSVLHLQEYPGARILVAMTLIINYVTKYVFNKVGTHWVPEDLVIIRPSHVAVQKLVNSLQSALVSVPLTLLDLIEVLKVSPAFVWFSLHGLKKVFQRLVDPQLLITSLPGVAHETETWILNSTVKSHSLKANAWSITKNSSVGLFSGAIALNSISSKPIYATQQDIVALSAHSKWDEELLESINLSNGTRSSRPQQQLAPKPAEKRPLVTDDEIAEKKQKDNASKPIKSVASITTSTTQQHKVSKVVDKSSKHDGKRQQYRKEKKDYKKKDMKDKGLNP